MRVRVFSHFFYTFKVHPYKKLLSLYKYTSTISRRIYLKYTKKKKKKKKKNNIDLMQLFNLPQIHPKLKPKYWKTQVIVRVGNCPG